MTSFADIKTRMADELDRSDMGTPIDRELRQAIKHYERKRWWFNEQLTTTTATSSMAFFEMPADLLILDHLEISISSRRYELDEMSWDRFVDEWRWNTNFSEPRDYARFNDRVWLGPAPRQDYPLIWHYIRTLYPASFTDGSDNAWTNYADDLVSARALKTLGMRTLHLSDLELREYAILEREAYNALCELSEQRLTTGTARPWQ